MACPGLRVVATSRELLGVTGERVEILQMEPAQAADVAKFKAAGVTINTVSPAELARIQEKVKPVVTKFAPLIGDVHALVAVLAIVDDRLNGPVAFVQARAAGRPYGREP